MKNKKNLIAVIALAALLLVGSISGIYAFFSQDTSFKNVFGVAEYAVDAYEKFTPPTDWQPGDTTVKQLFVKNTGDVDTVVRVKINTNSWVSANGTALSSQINGEDVAQLNFNNTDWTLDADGYYYYNAVLASGASTSNYLNSVTFNENAANTSVAVDANGKKYGDAGYDTEAWDAAGNYLGYVDAADSTIRHKAYASSGEGYDGATYTLEFEVQTLQATKNAMVSAWGYSTAATSGAAFDLYSSLAD